MRNTGIESSADRPGEFGSATKGGAALKAHVQLHARGFGVNPRTLLCGDALNQYAQPVLLLRLFADHPQRIGPRLSAWRPLSYLDYFALARPACSEFIALALRFCPGHIRETFERAEESLARAALEAIESALSPRKTTDPAERRRLCIENADSLQRDATALMTYADPDLATGRRIVSASPFFIRR